MSDKKFSTGSFQSNHAWKNAADIVSGSCTGIANTNSIDWNKQTTGITPDRKSVV